MIMYFTFVFVNSVVRGSNVLYYIIKETMGFGSTHRIFERAWTQRRESINEYQLNFNVIDY